MINILFNIILSEIRKRKLFWWRFWLIHLIMKTNCFSWNNMRRWTVHNKSRNITFIHMDFKVTQSCVSPVWHLCWCWPGQKRRHDPPLRPVISLFPHPSRMCRNLNCLPIQWKSLDYWIPAFLKERTRKEGKRKSRMKNRLHSYFLQ